MPVSLGTWGTGRSGKIRPGLINNMEERNVDTYSPYFYSYYIVFDVNIYKWYSAECIGPATIEVLMKMPFPLILNL